MPSPFVPFDTQYSAHTDVTINPQTGVVTITVAQHPNNKGPYNCKEWALDPPYTGQPRLVRDWVQGVASVGPFGHGAAIALPNGAMLTCVPVAGDSAEVRPSIHIEPNASAPYPLLSALAARITDLEARLNALPPTVTGGTLVIPAQLPPNEGGEIILLAGDGGQPWHIDVFHDTLRFHIGGVVVAEWKKPPIV